ncbi:chemokine XC receptor 1-like [Labrus bergylta]|uniref:chemokine XC receptor 1-like n=1 Tax=Labrus bergylta TaxID=56723 RepID=UPI003313773E
MMNFSTMGIRDLNNTDHLECPEMFDFNTLSGVFFILVFILSLIANVLLVCVVVIYEKVKNVTNVFILNLACADLLFTITLPFWAVYHMHHWVFGDFACKFSIAAYYVGVYSSVILLTAMTVDRFIAVVLHNWPCNPVRRQRCAKVFCAAAWIISIAASVSDAIKVKVVDWGNNGIGCEEESNEADVNLANHLQVLLLFFFPFAIIAFCYSAILWTVLQASNRKRYRTVVMVLCIVIAFFICWGPYNIMFLIASFHELKDCNARENFSVAFEIFRILAFSHCCMNPLLYMLSQKFRRHLMQLLRCNKPTRYITERGNGRSTSIFQNLAFRTQSSTVMSEVPSN